MDSQGFVADKAVVVANLKVQDKVVGPHAFVMDFRNESGDLVDNVTIHDMGIKSVGNDLDNAWIHFDNVELPRRRCSTDIRILMRMDNTY